MGSFVCTQRSEQNRTGISVVLTSVHFFSLLVVAFFVLYAKNICGIIYFRNFENEPKQTDG